MNGEEKYIFISYSHKDSQKVLPIIEVMAERGFRVWYDAGIEAGTEWPEYIEDRLKNASAVVVFMTPNTVASKNCRNEINFALDLNKDVLIVYLEDTELLKGMRLQLNSTQSLFRSHHLTNETFMRELLKARMLQKCLCGAESEEADPSEHVEIKAKSTTRISNICSIGSNDEFDSWPKGSYSQIVNRDAFSVIFFHISLLKPFGFSGTVVNKFQVYNSEGHLIYEEESPLQIEANYDKISKGWILRGNDGSFVPSGEYRFVCSINNSPSFTYFFSVTSNAEEAEPTLKKTGFFDKIKKMLQG